VGRPREVEQSVSAAISHRYGFDEMRRFAAALGTAAGLSPARSLKLASHLLWFDAAGAPNLGIATLDSWLDAIDGGRIDPKAMGRVVSERTATANFDGENGPTPLILERAAELAVEKARETSAGIVRVSHAAPVQSAAPAAAGIAVGPMAGWVLGPNHHWSMALPSQSGLPLVFDSGLAISDEVQKPGSAGARAGTGASKTSAARSDGPVPASALFEAFWLGIELLVPEDGWIVAAISVPAQEPLATFHERVASACRGLSAAPGRLLPEDWEAHRRQVRQHGVAVAPSAWKSLAQRAHRLNIETPGPIAD
jgi:LDH2 family malate/lactate/ureidoglycolate dehydrogenase